MKLFAVLVTLLFINPVFAKSYGLKAGAQAPQFELETSEGNNFSLYRELEDSKVILVFYRGGWCPYCNTQLRALQSQLLPKIEGKAKLVAISVDKVSEATKSQQNMALGFEVLSDSSAEVLKAYNVAFKVPPSLVKQYKGYGIDLNASSGQDHNIIAIPAVIIVGKDQKVIFNYANEDYKTRAKIKDILAQL